MKILPISLSEIGKIFKMDYSAVSQAAKRFEQKSEANHEIKEVMQKVVTVLKEEWMSNVETWPLLISFNNIPSED